MKKKFLLLFLFIPLLASCTVNSTDTKTDPEIEDKSDDRKDERVVSDLELKDYKVKFDADEAFSVGDLKVYAIYANGEKNLVTDYTVDSSKFDSSKAGKYEIVITYSQHKKSYTVNVGGQVDLPWV